MCPPHGVTYIVVGATRKPRNRSNGIYVVSLLHFVILFVQSLVVSLILTPVARRVAHRIGQVDHPGHRKVHCTPKAVLGGAAIFLTFHLVVLGDYFVLKYMGLTLADSQGWVADQIRLLWSHAVGARAVSTHLVGWLLGGMLVFLVGLWDDRHGMHPFLKLGAQVAAGTILFFVGIRITLFIVNPFLSWILTVGWVVAITNSFNLLDNMDGLSGGVASIALLLFAISSYTGGQDFLTASLVVLAASVCGFLWYNFYPSTIFMGDAGSMFVGYNLAALTTMLTFYGEQDTVRAWAVITPLVVLAVPIFDTLSVIVIRIRNGKPIYVGDTNHFSHRLVSLGMSHRRAVLVIYLVTLCTGLAALILPHLTRTRDAAIVFLQTVAVFCIISIFEYHNKNGASNGKNTNPPDSKSGTKER